MAKHRKGKTPWLLIGLGAAGLFLLAGGTASAAVQPPAPTPPAPPPPGPAPVPSPISAPVDTVWTTSGGKMHTRDAQGMLKGLGPVANDSRMTNLVVDGVWGPLSQQAAKDFQAIKGVTATGTIDPDTADTLYADWVAEGSP